MPKERKRPFNTDTYLATAGPGRKIIRLNATQIFSSQGDLADCLFYLQAGRAKLTIVSKTGKEATVTLLAPGDFFGEECMAGPNELRTTSATAITICLVLRIASTKLTRVLHEENAFSDLFVQFLALRSTRTQADLVDQLFNNSERRLARTLLLMADYGNESGPEPLIPPVTQETLAEMIGTTRSRVSFFMNRFKKLGYISYKNRIRVHKLLLMMVLEDRLPEQNASRPKLLDPSPVAHEPPGESSDWKPRIPRVKPHSDSLRQPLRFSRRSTSQNRGKIHRCNRFCNLYLAKVCHDGQSRR